MSRRLGSDLFALPPFEDDDTRRTAALMRAALSVQVIGVSAYGFLVHASDGLRLSEKLGMLVHVALLAIAIAIVSVGNGAPRAQALRLAGALAVASQLTFFLLGMFTHLGGTSAAGCFIAVLLAGQLFGARGALVTSGVCLLGIVIAGAVEAPSLITYTPMRLAAGYVTQLSAVAVFVILASRSSLGMLQHLRSEQAVQRALNIDLARLVRDEESLVTVGRLLVEGESLDESLAPAVEALGAAWGQPIVLFGRGHNRPKPVAQAGTKAAVLVGGDDEAARVVSDENVIDVTVVDGARTFAARAVGVRTGTVPHGVLAAITNAGQDGAHDGGRRAQDVDPLLRGAAALLAAAFEWRDATGRLRAAERRRAALVKSSPDGLLIIDEQGTIIDANAAAVRVFTGTVPVVGGEGLVGRALAQLDVLSPDDVQRVARALADSRAGRATDELSLTLRYDRQRPGVGAHAQLELRVFYSIDDGRGRFDVVIRDVTAKVDADRARERLEAQLFAARRLEALGQLAGGVAHDFNNLLSVILTNARLLADKDDLDAQSKDDLKEIVDCGRRAADLTGQLLTFARQQRREPRLVDVNGAVRGVEKLLRRLIPSDITLSFVLAPDAWPVIVDPAQLEQVLVNLVANARDAMEKGGTCTVTTRNVSGDARTLGIADDSLSGLDEGRYVELTVTDTGSGMDDETKAHVFEPFFTTKPPGRGSGLGLATVYGIVKQSGGAIAVESVRGQGSTFRVLFPYAAFAEDDQATPAAGDALAKGTERVLVVDDDDAVRRATERALVSRGFSVLVARGPSEALLLTNERFDVVVADLVMPDMAGDVLVKRLRARHRDLPCVLLTGYGRRSVELVRPFRLLRKPSSPEELARSVRAVIDEATVGRGTGAGG